MRFVAGTTAIFAFASVVSAAPAPPLKEVIKYGGEVHPDSFIIKYKSGVTTVSTNDLGSGSNLTHGPWDPSFFNGFAAKLDKGALDALRADPNVEWIEEDGIVHTMDIVTQSDAPWGISRISQDAPQTQTDPLANNFVYNYDSAAGSGVDIYIIDTGINIAHSEFGGRAVWGKTFGPYADADGHGHGTHCAGTAAGRRWGVAKNANVIAVKVLSDEGKGKVSDIVSGMDFVLASAKNSRRPTVASMSLGGPVSTSLDEGVARLTDGGVHVTVAAGNDKVDASTQSPARASTANTIGATDITDAIATFSNFGPSVELFAPGVMITSAWIGSPNATNAISGTSMATPHVAGLIAYLISVGGDLPTTYMTALLQQLAVKDVISNLPSNTFNALARNDISSGSLSLPRGYSNLRR